MTPGSIIVAITALALASAASAQRTWVVDSRGGPGTDFLDIQPAVTASNPRDTILVVLALNSSPFVWYRGAIIDKPLRVIGVSELGTPPNPGQVGLQDKLVIRNIPAGEDVLVAYLSPIARLDSSPPYAAIPHGFLIQNCAGRVHLESIGYHPAWTVGAGEFRIEDSANVTLHWCGVTQPGPYPSQYPLVIRRSNVTINDCGFWGWYAPILGCFEPTCPDHTENTLRIEDSTVFLTDSIVMGVGERNSSGNGRQPARNAIDLVNSTLVVGTSCHLEGGWRTGGSAIPAVQSQTTTGSVERDPRGYCSGVAGLAEQVHNVHSVMLERPVRNQLFRVTVSGEPFGLALLALGFPLPNYVPIPLGNLLIDPTSMGVIGIGLFDYYGFLNLQYGVSAHDPMDMLFVLQAATLDRNNNFRLTWPAVFSIGWEVGHTWP